MPVVRAIEKGANDSRDRPIKEVKVASASCKKLTPHEYYQEEFAPQTRTYKNLIWNIPSRLKTNEARTSYFGHL